MANFIRLNTVLTSPNIVKLSRDALLNANTRFMFDFGRTQTYPLGVSNVADNTMFNNMVEGGEGLLARVVAPATLDYDASKKAVFLNPASVQGVCYMRLPESAVFTGTAKGFLFTVWFEHKISTLTPDTANNIVVGFSYQNSTYNQYLIQSSPSNSTYSFRVNGGAGGVGIPFPNVGVTMQLAISYDEQSGVLKLYVNGALQSSIATAPPLKNPRLSSFTVNPTIGLAGAYTPGFNGGIKRIWAEESANADHADKVLKDYNTNVTRLS